MKIEVLTLGVCVALCASVPMKAQVTWSATGSPPAQTTTLVGGPWLLPQGGPYVETSGTTTSGGPFDGTTPYCSGGVPIVNPNTGPALTMQPFYFPFVSGR